jgi:hypothetical protein
MTNKDYYQHFDELINHINKTIPALVKEYNLEVYHSGGGCFILQIDKGKIEIGITPIEKIIVNEHGVAFGLDIINKEVIDISYDLTLIKDDSTKCLFTKNNDGECIDSFILPLLEGLQKLRKEGVI